MSVNEFVDLSSTDVTGSIVMTVNKVLKSVYPITDHERGTGRQSPEVVLSAEMVEQIKRHDMTYFQECGWCPNAWVLPEVLVPLHLLMHLPETSRAGITLHYVGDPGKAGAGVLLSLHNHDLGQVVGMASALALTCTDVQHYDHAGARVRFGGYDYLQGSVSLVWYAEASGVKDILTLFPGVPVKGSP
jgi:hypothetical protein